jgi:positive regulator of sigma E activity
MDKTRGRILSIQPDGTRATVEVDTVNFCARCSTGKGCGAGLFGNDRGPRQFDAPVFGQLELRAGDEVRIELAPQSVLQAALIVYGVPLGMTLLMAGIAYLAGLADEGAVLAVLVGMAAGAYIGRRRLQRSHCLRQFTPAITGRLARAQ